MGKILEELWYGNVCPDIGCRTASEERKELLGYVAKHYDKLRATLADGQQEILEKFDDCRAELTDREEREIFVYAFRLGARIAMEIMQFEAE